MRLRTRGVGARQCAPPATATNTAAPPRPAPPDCVNSVSGRGRQLFFAYGGRQEGSGTSSTNGSVMLIDVRATGTVPPMAATSPDWFLPSNAELRFTAGADSTVELVEGSAELFGVELVKGRTYHLPAGRHGSIGTFYTAKVGCVPPPRARGS